MIGPFNELRQKRWRAAAGPALGRGADPPAARTRLGERRVPAGAARGRRSRRPARRALFHVHGGRRLLRGDPRAGRARALHAGRWRSSTCAAGPRRRRRRRHDRAYRRSQLAFYEKHHPRWAPLLKLYLRLRGRGLEAGGPDGSRPDAHCPNPELPNPCKYHSACGSASTPASCTTSASAPTSAICCGSSRGSISETEFVLLCRPRRRAGARRRSARTSGRSSRRPATTPSPSRSGFRSRCSAKASRCFTRRTTCCRRSCACRSVVTIHDCIHLMFPQYLPNRLALAYARTSIALAARRATRVLTVSESSKRDILRFVDVDPRQDRRHLQRLRRAVRRRAARRGCRARARALSAARRVRALCRQRQAAQESRAADRGVRPGAQAAASIT